jgi:hypothetical protein
MVFIWISRYTVFKGQATAKAGAYDNRIRRTFLKG